jgi:hypothetical protein
MKNDETTQRKIDECIQFLKEHGYTVQKVKDVESYIGKWVAYRREGMEPILHGKVVGYNGCLHIKKKNNGKDFANLENVIQFFDSKEECYAFK